MEWDGKRGAEIYSLVRGVFCWGVIVMMGFVIYLFTLDVRVLYSPAPQLQPSKEDRHCDAYHKGLPELGRSARATNAPHRPLQNLLYPHVQVQASLKTSYPDSIHVQLASRPLHLLSQFVSVP